jgi:hypothetical protein
MKICLSDNIFCSLGGVVEEVAPSDEAAPAAAVPKVKIKLIPGAMVATPVSEKRKRKKSRKYASDDEPMEEVPEEVLPPQ